MAMTTTAGTHSPALDHYLMRLDAGALFSEVAESAAGGAVVCANLHRTVPLALDEREHHLLESWRDGATAGVRRKAVLRASGARDMGRVTSVYLPQRLGSASVARELHTTDIPLGVALRPLGVVRRSLGARVVHGTPVSLRCSGVLLLPGEDGDLVPVALAAEELLSEVLPG
jgi:hypothetical protein